MCAVVSFHPAGITAIRRGLSVRDTHKHQLKEQGRNNFPISRRALAQWYLFRTDRVAERRKPPGFVEFALASTGRLAPYRY